MDGRSLKGSGLWKIRLSMFGTLAIIIGLSTVFFAVILGALGLLNIFSLMLFVVPMNLLQWLLAPYFINSLYKIKEIRREDSPRLYEIGQQLAVRSGIKAPKLGIARMPIPNAFAYGSPIAGNHIAVTQGLLDMLEEEEIDAVVAHEFGHLKHRDVQIMMLVSFLPALFYFLYQYTLMSTYFGGRNRRDGGGMISIGIASISIYFVLTFLTLGLSRLREYYADRHSVLIVDDGARKLSEGLAKIVNKTSIIRKRHHLKSQPFNSFKSLFISDPDTAQIDSARIGHYATRRSDQALVAQLSKRRITTADKMIEIFSSHPNITKRLKALQAL